MSVAKGLLFGVQAVMKPRRVKTAASFTAEDPWNQNRRSSFVLDEYLLLLDRATVTESTKATATDFQRALRSEIDGVEHWLPDSLSELWRRKQVSSEALPRLLKEAEPTLKKGDYAVVMRNKALTLIAIINTCICLGVVLFTVVGLANVDGPLLPRIGVGLLVAGICWLLLYWVSYGKRLRRRRQMKWFLERIDAGGQAIESARIHPAGYQQ